MEDKRITGREKELIEEVSELIKEKELLAGALLATAEALREMSAALRTLRNNIDQFAQSGEENKGEKE